MCNNNLYINIFMLHHHHMITHVYRYNQSNKLFSYIRNEFTHNHTIVTDKQNISSKILSYTYNGNERNIVDNMHVLLVIWVYFISAI